MDKNNPPIVTGDLADPTTLERLKAVAKAKSDLIHAIDKQTIREASGFGSVAKEVNVERDIVETVGDEKSQRIKAELDSQLVDGMIPSGAALSAGIQSGGMNATVVPVEKLDETKALRDKLAAIWSKDAKDTDPSADFYIEGIDMGNTAIRNPNAGDSGVRMSFKVSPKNCELFRSVKILTQNEDTAQGNHIRDNHIRDNLL